MSKTVAEIIVHTDEGPLLIVLDGKDGFCTLAYSPKVYKIEFKNYDNSSNSN